MKSVLNYAEEVSRAPGVESVEVSESRILVRMKGSDEVRTLSSAEDVRVFLANIRTPGALR